MITHLGVDHSLWSSTSGSTRQEYSSTYSEMADSHTYETKEKNNKITMKRPPHGTTADFFFAG